MWSILVYIQFVLERMYILLHLKTIFKISQLEEECFFFAKSIYIFTGILSIRCIITKRSMLKSSIIIFDLCICLPFLSILWYFIYFEAMLWDLHKFKIVSFPDALTLIIRKYPSLSLTRLLVWMSTLFYISFLLLSIFRIYVFHPLLSISLLYLMAFF